jgi:hypothetical protein
MNDMPARMTAEDMAQDDLRRGRAPRNYLEAVMAEHQAKQRAAEIAAEERDKRLGIWSTSMNQWVAPAVAERLPELRKIETRDQSGRVITTWEGSPSAWLRNFMSEPKRLVGFNTR